MRFDRLERVLDVDQQQVLDRLISVSGIVERFDVPPTTVYDWLAAPGFPSPLRVPGVKVRIWDVAEITAWRAVQRKGDGDHA